MLRTPLSLWLNRRHFDRVSGGSLRQDSPHARFQTGCDCFCVTISISRCSSEIKPRHGRQELNGIEMGLSDGSSQPFFTTFMQTWPRNLYHQVSFPKRDVLEENSNHRHHKGSSDGAGVGGFPALLSLESVPGSTSPERCLGYGPHLDPNLDPVPFLDVVSTSCPLDLNLKKRHPLGLAHLGGGQHHVEEKAP